MKALLVTHCHIDHVGRIPYLLPAPKPPYRADYLVIESTYGDKLHEFRRERRRYLQQTIEKSFLDGGTVLIPAFSIGRTQELLYELEEIIHRIDRARQRNASSLQAETSVWEYLDIIVDSPLAAKFTESYRELKNLWDAEVRRKVKAGRHPLGFESLLTIYSHKEHLNTVEYLRKTGRPAIVIAASGTPGRDIQKYAPNISGSSSGYVLLEGQKVDIKAQVHTLSGYMLMLIKKT